MADKSAKDAEAKKPIPVGGQAVIEGVLMKSPNHIAISVRTEDGKIVSKEEKLNKKPKWAEFFFIRGIYNLIEMLIIGINALTWSSNQALKEEEEKEGKAESKDKKEKDDSEKKDAKAEKEKKDGKDKDQISTKEIIFILLASFALVIVIFVALPYLLTILLGVKEEEAPFLFNLIDGIIKITFFIIYIWIISQMKDVKRLFQYHGAEHMAVHCYEHNEELNVKNCKKYSTIHTRCGSSFMMLVLVISILILAVIPSIVIALNPSFLSLNFWQQKAILFPLRILAIPIIAGISYEVLKLADRYKKNPLMAAVSYPGALLQKMTTKQPDDQMIEVAISALNNALEIEEKYKKSSADQAAG